MALAVCLAESTLALLALPLLAEATHNDPLWLTITLTYLVPIGGLIAAGLAAWFAGRALHYIRAQIDLANEQIALANQQIRESHAQTTLAQSALELAKDEFSATIETLNITRAQAAKTAAKEAKTPELAVTFAGKTTRFEVSTYEGQDYFAVPLFVSNLGDATANNVLVVLIFHHIADHSPEGATHAIHFAESNGAATSYVERALIPGDQASLGVAYCNAKPGQYEIYWSARSSEGDWPNTVGRSKIGILVLDVLDVESPGQRRSRELQEIESDPAKRAELEASLAQFGGPLADVAEALGQMLTYDYKTDPNAIQDEGAGNSDESEAT